MKRKIFEAGRILLEAVLIAALTLLGVVPFSCKVSAEGIEIIGGDYTAPVIEAVNVIDEETVIMEFSDSVKMSNVVVSPFIPGISDSSNHSQTEELSPSLAAASGLFSLINLSILCWKMVLMNRASTSSCTINKPTGTAKPIAN